MIALILLTVLAFCGAWFIHQYTWVNLFAWSKAWLVTSLFMASILYQVGMVSAHAYLNACWGIFVSVALFMEIIGLVGQYCIDKGW